MANFIFTGDSIIEWFNVYTYFPNLKIKNYGIAGDTIQGVYSRINKALNQKPASLLVMVGHNDLCMQYSSEEAILRYEKICNEINKYEIENVFLSGLLPIDFITKDTVIDFNSRLKLLANKNNFTYIEVRENFINKSGKAEKELSDGLHLTQKGYDKLAEVFRRYIK